MKLKFLGKNGWRRLRKGWVYDCSIWSSEGKLWVVWETWGCQSYDSIKELLKDWTDEI